MCTPERSKTTPTSSESVRDVRPAPTSSVPMRMKDVICVYMGLQKCIKDTTDNMRESQVRAP